MNTENLKGLIASELIIVAREEKDKRPTELNFEELIDVTDSIVKKLILYGVVWRSEPCGLLHSTDWNGKCFKCGEQVFEREPK